MLWFFWGFCCFLFNVDAWVLGFLLMLMFKHLVSNFSLLLWVLLLHGGNKLNFLFFGFVDVMGFDI